MEELDSKTMDSIGLRAKELSKELENVLKLLQQMNFTNYDQNKIEYLYELLEKSLESGDHSATILQRLTCLEKIHKESPNIQDSLTTIKKR